MLVKQTLEDKIERAIHDAMKNAIDGMNKTMIKSVNNNGDGSDFSMNKAVDVFADESKKCAKDIADAIDEYIKSATIILNVNSQPIAIAPTLMSPTGPVTGSITLMSPATLSITIK